MSIDYPRRYKGKTVAQWARETGIKERTLRSRLVNRWGWREALQRKPQEGKYPKTYQGKTVKEWSKELGISYFTITGRLRNGWSWNQVITTPPMEVGMRVRDYGTGLE